MTQTFKRRLIRERVLQILYAYEINRENLEILIGGILSDVTEPADKDFANTLINRVLIHKVELDKLIEERVTNWELSRIALIDKLLLRMAICELLYFPDIPLKVSINEAIELGKSYSTAGSPKFLNGILDSVMSDLKNSNRINKTGRGLLEEKIPKQPKNKK